MTPKIMIATPMYGGMCTGQYWLCRDNGVKIHIAPWVRLGHTGTYQFNGSVIPVSA